MFARLRRLIFFLAVSDVILTQLVLVAADVVRRNGQLGLPIEGADAILPPMLWIVASLIYPAALLTLGVYNAQRSRTLTGGGVDVLRAVIVGTLVFAGTLYFTDRQVSRLFVGYVFVFEVVALIVWRMATLLTLRLFRRQGRSMLRVLVVGRGELADAILTAFGEQLHPAVHVVGLADDGAETDPRYPRLGGIDDVPALVRAHAVDEVVLALPLEEQTRIPAIEAALLTEPVRVRLVPDYTRLVFVQSSVETVGGVPLIGLREPRIQGAAWLAKRLLDVWVTAAVVALIWPLLALIAVAIKFDSPGPAIFKQRRLGENGRPFWMLKFRTMVADAEQRAPVNGHEKRADDPRVTRVGRWLRRTSLDELPQLFNILKGEMSLVGPRPEVLKLTHEYEPWQRQRLAVPPGLTGWWQVNGRSDLPLHLNTHMDLYYIQNYSLWLDLVILWKTVGVVLRRQGAY